MPLFILAHLSHHLVTALPPPLLPYIRDEFALDYTRAGLIISAFGVVYGVCQLPAGWLADRAGSRTLLTVGIVGVAGTGLLAAASQNYWMLIASMVLMGVLGGGYHPAATAMLSAAVAARQRGRALGFHMVGGSASYFLAPLIAAGLAAIGGWRVPFIALGLPAMALGVMLHIIVKRRIPDRKVKVDSTVNLTEAPHISDRMPRLVTLITLSTLTQAVLMSIVSFVPLYLVDNFGTANELAAASISLVYFMGLWAGPVGGHLSDRFGRMVIVVIMCSLGSLAIYLLSAVPYGMGIAVLLVLIGIAIYFNTTAAQAYIVDQVSERRRSTVLGIYFFGNMEGAGVLTPVLGYLIDHFGFQFSFTSAGVFLAAILMIATTILWLKRT